MTSEDVAHAFYAAFSKTDGAATSALYAGDIEFSDAVFVGLRGDEAGAMWRMLCDRAKDLVVELVSVEATTSGAKGRWQARYTFATGRKVLNVIDFEMEIRDGRIHRHKDSFDFWRWSRQALGPAGLLLGWTPLLRNAVRRRARAGLDEWMATEAKKT